MRQEYGKKLKEEAGPKSAPLQMKGFELTRGRRRKENRHRGNDAGKKKNLQETR